MGFYLNTLKRCATAAGNRLAETGDDLTQSIALTPEECEWALQGNPPPSHCRAEVEALHHRWIVSIEEGRIVVTRAGGQGFSPET